MESVEASAMPKLIGSPAHKPPFSKSSSGVEGLGANLKFTSSVVLVQLPCTTSAE